MEHFPCPLTPLLLVLLDDQTLTFASFLSMQLPNIFKQFFDRAFDLQVGRNLIDGQRQRLQAYG